MKKYIGVATFHWNEEMMQLIPEHREHIDGLIQRGALENYVVSMEVQTVWFVMNASSKEEVRRHLRKSPLYKYWKLEVNELMVWDGNMYRLPVVTLN